MASEDKFLYKIVGWRGSVFPGIYYNLTYDQLISKINENAGTYNVREFFISMQSNTIGLNDMVVPLFDFDCPVDADGNVCNRMETYRDICVKVSSYFLDGAFIYSTLKGFHVIGNRLVRHEEYMSLLDLMNCCPGYISVSKSNSFGALRIGCKEYRAPDVSYDGFIFPGNLVGMSNGIDIDSDILDFIATKNRLEAKMRKLYIYNQGVPIFPDFLDLNNPEKGFKLNSDGTIAERIVDVDAFSYEY